MQIELASGAKPRDDYQTAPTFKRYAMRSPRHVLVELESGFVMQMASDELFCNGAAASSETAQGLIVICQSARFDKVPAPPPTIDAAP